MKVLSTDIGGTKTRIALLSVDRCRIETLVENSYASRDFASLEDILEKFFSSNAITSDAAGIGVAGPVHNGRCETTNLPWVIDSATLANTLGLPRVHLLNDLEATAWGTRALISADIDDLNPSATAAPEGNISVVAAGTGLGQAGIFRRNDLWAPFATEGGHSDFAPASELEYALHAYLKQRYGRVSWERVASGMGICDLFRFLLSTMESHPHTGPTELEISEQGAAVISQRADDGTCPVCAATMDLFVQLYGREVGNHALKIMATGGVYIGGGIAPKILHRLRQPAFLEAFLDKGRMRPLLESMPLKVILNDRAALYGAALAAVE